MNIQLNPKIVKFVLGALVALLIGYAIIISVIHFNQDAPVPCLDLACECVACINHIPETPAQQ